MSRASALVMSCFKLSDAEALQAQVCRTSYVERLSMLMRATGKTLLAKTLAKVLDVPFSVSDATSFTQVRNTYTYVA